jgi:hypothetical protein
MGSCVLHAGKVFPMRQLSICEVDQIVKVKPLALKYVSLLFLRFALVGIYRFVVAMSMRSRFIYKFSSRFSRWSEK